METQWRQAWEGPCGRAWRDLGCQGMGAGTREAQRRGMARMRQADPRQTEELLPAVHGVDPSRGGLRRGGHDKDTDPDDNPVSTARKGG